MSVTVYKYNVWCETEGKYVYVWGETEPTKCPNDTAHTIDTSKTSVDDIIEENVIQIKEENTPTGGHYRSKGVAFDAENGLTTYHDFSIPYPISLLSATIPTNDLNSGDITALDVAPDTLIGAITSSVSVGDTVINVQPSVIENVAIGRCLTLDDGTNSERHSIVAIDSDAGTLTIDTGTTYAYSAASPTYCKFTICLSTDLDISSGDCIILGNSKIGGSYIPANTIFRIKYVNNGDAPVKIRLYLEFLY